MQKKETTRTRILLLAHETGLVPWKDVPVAIPDTSYCVVRRLVNALIECEFLYEVRVPGIRKRYLAITKAGVEYLEKVFGIKLGTQKNRLKYTDSLPKKRKRRLVRVAEALSYLMNNSIYVLPSEKPTLEALTTFMFDTLGPLGNLKAVVTPDNVADNDDDFDSDDAGSDDTPPELDPWSAERPTIDSVDEFNLLLDFGIFYSSAEIRTYAKTQQFYRDLEGVVDVMGRSRFIGVVFKRNELYIIYNTRDNLMMWYDGIEERTEQAIRQMFSRYKGYELHNAGDGLGKLPAVVFGETMATLPALVTGHKHGVDRTVKHNKYPRTYRQINAATSAYNEVYFVPTEKAGQEILAATLTHSRAERYNNALAFLESFGPSVGIRKDSIYPYGHSSDHFDFAYLPVFDIKYIAWLRERKDKILVATYAEAANAVSKSLGDKMIGGMDFRMDESGQRPKLQYKHYDKGGREVR